MSPNACQNAKKGAKTGFYLLVVLLLFMPLSIKAFYLIDDFEDYPIGELIGNDNWYDYNRIATSSIIKVINHDTYYGQRAIQSQGSGDALYKDIATRTELTTSVALRFELHGATCVGAVMGIFLFSPNQAYCYADVQFISGGMNMNIVNNYDWHILSIKADINGAYCSSSLDGSAWTPAFSSNWHLADGVSRLGVHQVNNMGNTCYLYQDHIIEPTIGVQVVEPTTPLDCIPNIVDFDNLQMAGSVNIPAGDLNIYNKLIIKFDIPLPLESGIMGYDVEIPLPDLTNGQSYNYATTTSLPTSSEAYLVSYVVQGNNPQNGEPTSYDNLCFGTYIAESWLPYFPKKEIVLKRSYATTTLEDCDTFSGIDKIICDIRNTIVSAFYPTPAKLQELQNNADIFKSKFPFNYILATQDFFDSVNQNSQTQQALTLNILGTSGNVDFSFWQQSSGGTITGTFLSIFRGFLTILVLVVFIFWGINYAKRIF